MPKISKELRDAQIKKSNEQKKRDRDFIRRYEEEIKYRRDLIERRHMSRPMEVSSAVEFMSGECVVEE